MGIALGHKYRWQAIYKNKNVFIPLLYRKVTILRECCHTNTYWICKNVLMV